MIQTKVDDVVEALKKHSAAHDKSYYTKIRDNDSGLSSVDVAARFIYLNRTCFNGLYRVNKSGKFNVPIGRYTNPTICDSENLSAVSLALDGVDICLRGFEKISPKSGDFVYCDPPYDGTFTGYTKDRFDQDEQRRLRDSAVEWANNGSHVIVSNSDTLFIRRLYKEWRVVEVRAGRNISRNAANRHSVTELLIVSQ